MSEPDFAVPAPPPAGQPVNPTPRTGRDITGESRDHRGSSIMVSPQLLPAKDPGHIDRGAEGIQKAKIMRRKSSELVEKGLAMPRLESGSMVSVVTMVNSPRAGHMKSGSNIPLFTNLSRPMMDPPQAATKTQQQGSSASSLADIVTNNTEHKVKKTSIVSEAPASRIEGLTPFASLYDKLLVGGEQKPYTKSVHTLYASDEQQALTMNVLEGNISEDNPMKKTILKTTNTTGWNGNTRKVNMEGESVLPYTLQIKQDRYYHSKNAPRISSISPKQGGPSGGTRLVIGGTNFGNGSGLKVVFRWDGPELEGGMPADLEANDVVFAGKQIMCLSPASPVQGPWRVIVSVNGEEAVKPDVPARTRFTYLGPLINKLEPSSGPVRGGTELRIYGSGFGESTKDITVTIDGTRCSNVDVLAQGRQVVCVTPPHNVGKALVVVDGPNGTTVETSNCEYEYINDGIDVIGYHRPGKHIKIDEHAGGVDIDIQEVLRLVNKPASREEVQAILEVLRRYFRFLRNIFWYYATLRLDTSKLENTLQQLDGISTNQPGIRPPEFSESGPNPSLENFGDEAQQRPDAPESTTRPERSQNRRRRGIDDDDPWFMTQNQFMQMFLDCKLVGPAYDQVGERMDVQKMCEICERCRSVPGRSLSPEDVLGGTRVAPDDALLIHQFFAALIMAGVAKCPIAESAAVALVRVVELSIKPHAESIPDMSVLLSAICDVKTQDVFLKYETALRKYVFLPACKQWIENVTNKNQNKDMWIYDQRTGRRAYLEKHTEKEGDELAQPTMSVGEFIGFCETFGLFGEATQLTDSDSWRAHSISIDDIRRQYWLSNLGFWSFVDYGDELYKRCRCVGLCTCPPPHGVGFVREHKAIDDKPAGGGVHNRQASNASASSKHGRKASVTVSPVPPNANSRQTSNTSTKMAVAQKNHVASSTGSATSPLAHDRVIPQREGIRHSQLSFDEFLEFLCRVTMLQLGLKNVDEEALKALPAPFEALLEQALLRIFGVEPITAKSPNSNDIEPQPSMDSNHERQSSMESVPSRNRNKGSIRNPIASKTPLSSDVEYVRRELAPKLQTKVEAKKEGEKEEGNEKLEATLPKLPISGTAGAGIGSVVPKKFISTSPRPSIVAASANSPPKK